jgi:1-acyl-sn-glycerol-3-phosphate acyltransferase
MANRVLPFAEGAVPMPGSVVSRSGFGAQRAFFSFQRRCLAFNAWLATGGAGAGATEVRRRLGERCGEFFGDLSERGLVHCRWEGFEQAADWKGSIVVANHPTILDALWFFWRLPGIGCVVGANPWGNPLLSHPARRAAFVPRDPALRMLKEGRRRLGHGENILLFPEGTRTTLGALNPFFAGPALLAVKSGAPVRTVFIECDSLFLGKGYSFLGRTPGKIEFRFSTGEVLRPVCSETARAFARRMEEHYRAQLGREDGGIFRVRP